MIGLHTKCWRLRILCSTLLVLYFKALLYHAACAEIYSWIAAWTGRIIFVIKHGVYVRVYAYPIAQHLTPSLPFCVLKEVSLTVTQDSKSIVNICIYHKDVSDDVDEPEGQCS